KLLSSTVRVNKIEGIPATFSKASLEEAAHLILAAEGVITPPILLRTGIESYRVIEGIFEYHAALTAMDLNKHKGKQINAYIVESEEELAIYQKQIKVFRHRDTMSTPIITQEINVPKEERLISLEKTVRQLVEQQARFEQTVTDALDRLTTVMTSQPRSTPAVAAPLDLETSSPKPTVSVDTEIKCIEDLNTLSPQELSMRLSRIQGIRMKTIPEIVKRIVAEREKQPFFAKKEIQNRAQGSGLLGKSTLDKIFNQW
ncbi:MAG: hypothetical protein KAH77_10805, partial [Thiomargarita sp.]|nr:hypothetical protein [Thiomargarita sp.]